MQVLAVDFINSPALYLDKVRDSAVTIIKDGSPIAMLVKPSTAPAESTPISNRLLGVLKDSGINSEDDIKDMRLGV